MIHRMMNGVSEGEIQEHTPQRIVCQLFCARVFTCVYVLSKLEGSAVNTPVLLVSLRGKSLLALAALWGIMKHEDDTLLFNLSSHFHFTQHSTDLLSVCVENLCYLPV